MCKEEAERRNAHHLTPTPASIILGRRRMSDPIRILHLHQAADDFQTRRAGQQLRKNLGAGFAAEEMPLRPGLLRVAVTGARAIRARDCDIVHAFGMESLIAAALARARRIVFSPPAEMPARQARMLRAILQLRPIEVVCAAETQRRMLVERGVPLERCHAIRPGVDFARVRRRRDNSLRAALGFAHEDRVLLACGESTAAADHRLAVWTTGILHHLDPRYRLLLWGRGAGVARLHAFEQSIGASGAMRIAEAALHRPLEFEELLPAADFILSTARGPVSLLPVGIAMAAALPIVSTVTYSTGELLEDRHNALLVTRRSPSELARRCMQFREDAQLQWRLCDTARSEVYQHLPLTRFIERWREVYRCVAEGRRVELPGV